MILKSNKTMPDPQKTNIKRARFKGWKLLKIFVIIYCSAGIALYYLQEKLMFHPQPLAPDYQFKFNVPFKEVNIPLNSKDNLNIVRFLTRIQYRKALCFIFMATATM